jgi:hypothetical protein
VLANDFGSDNNNWFYNEGNFQRYWYASSLNADWKTASNWSRNNNVNPTDMYGETRSAHDNSDVASYVQDLGEGEPPGETECIDSSGSTPWICYHWHVRYNTYYASSFDTLEEKKRFTCHEFGHTPGLFHGSTSGSCMNSPVTSKYFSSHDIAHVNNYYPTNPNG